MQLLAIVKHFNIFKYSLVGLAPWEMGGLPLFQILIWCVSSIFNELKKLSATALS